jgi:hypothetical protein
MSDLFPAGTRHLRDQIVSTFLTLFFGLTPLLVHAQPLGGFLEKPLTLTTALEPVLSPTDLNSFVPAKGKFTFPAPYNTQAVRLTNAADCGGQDCVNAIGYSYWRNINNHVGKDSMLILLGLSRDRGGAGLTLLQYNKITDVLSDLGPVFPDNSPYGWASGEGWYFSATLPTRMYLNTGAKILRYDVMSKQFETIVDVNAELGAGHIIHQIHSSNDDRVHSGTVRSASNYAMLGCMAYESDSDEFHYFPAIGDYDECQIDKSGKWLVIKENVDNAEGEDNRIINLDTGNERLLRDSDGAGGHSDLGFGYMVAADNWDSSANAQKMWDFNDSTMTGTTVYANRDWNVATPSHVSHTNATNAPPEQQYACGSSANRRNSAEANEVVCFRLDGSGNVLVVAPVMTSLDSRGGGDYDNSPKGNLDVTGQYFIWTSNMGGSRLDAFLVKVPSQLLGGSSAVTDTSGGATGGTGVVVDSNTTAPVTSSVSPLPTLLDKTGPVISNLSANSFDPARALFMWSTNEPAVQRLEYGTSTAYGKTTAFTTQLSSSHTVSLRDLTGGTLYHYRIHTRDAAGNLTTSPDYTLTTAGAVAPTQATPAPTPTTTAPAPTAPVPTAPAATSAAIVWIDAVNATDTSGSVKKTGGCDGCADAGAASQQQIAGKGYFEFTATVESGLRFVGLADSNGGTTAADIDFGLRLQGSAAEVRENGTYRTELGFAAGDTFRIDVENGKVTYAKNGTVFYTSTASVPSVLRADTALYSAGSSIANAKIVTPSKYLAWTNQVNVTATETSLQKTAGCDSCPDATALSAEQIASGNGHVQFTATVEDKLRGIGLTNATASYGLSLQGSIAEVREGGAYRADVTFKAGDVFRIVVENGVVSYVKNGVAFYTSTVAATSALRAIAVFYSTGGTIREAQLQSAP